MCSECVVSPDAHSQTSEYPLSAHDAFNLVASDLGAAINCSGTHTAAFKRPCLGSLLQLEQLQSPCSVFACICFSACGARSGAVGGR